MNRIKRAIQRPVAFFLLQNSNVENKVEARWWSCYSIPIINDIENGQVRLRFSTFQILLLCATVGIFFIFYFIFWYFGQVEIKLSRC